MACDVVSVVIWSLPSHKELKIQSPRVAVVDKCVEDVLEACSKEQNKDRFCTFLYGTSDIAEVNIRHPQVYWTDTRTRQPGPPLLAANGSSIRTYGKRTLSLHFASYTYLVRNIHCIQAVSALLMLPYTYI